MLLALKEHITLDQKSQNKEEQSRQLYCETLAFIQDQAAVYEEFMPTGWLLNIYKSKGHNPVCCPAVKVMRD